MGQPARPDGESDDDLKLLALRNVLASDPDRAIPAIEKMIQANNSPKVKDQALFVLAQSGSPKALEVLSRIAKGSGNPDLQLKAIRYLGVFGQSGRYILRRDGGSVTVLNGARRSADGKADPKVEDARRANAQMLADIYSASTNLDVKREVLRSFMMTGEKERLLELAKNEKSPELRAEAIRQLGSMGGQTDLYKLYQVDLAAEVRRQIISAMVMSRSADQLLEIARAETDPKLRALAIQNLGVLSSSGWYMGDRRTYALARPAVRAPQAPTPPAAATPPTARTAPTPPAVATPAQPVPPAAAATPRAAAPLVWAAGASSTPVDTVKIGEGLASIYKSDKDADVRKAVIEALYRQQNAKALVDIARVETDPAMKKALVQRLSTMKAKEATDYMLELLK
jgi:HEAT repeat protein